MIVFGKQIEARAFISNHRSWKSLSAAAISWESGEHVLAAVLWIPQRRGNGTINGVRFHTDGYIPAATMLMPWDNPEAPSGLHPISLLRSLSALSRQRLTREDSPKLHQSVRGLARSSGITQEQFRRIYLQRPEAAEHELAAAQAHAEGRTPAGHWVRGHWRQQYYASIDQHRATWIEGFPRGDFSRPADDRPRVLIARGEL